MKKEIAVIGSGIAGMATAYYLRNDFDVTLVEKNNYIGGHTNTVFISENGRKVPIDTGFMVFNETTYPNLIRLFQDLGVTSYDTSMSFGVHTPNEANEFACSGFSSFFARKRNLANPVHWKLYREILKFFAHAETLIAQSPPASYTIANFANACQLGERVMNRFVIPMASAIWSTPPQGILNFPALPLLRFMRNHRMLGIGIQLQWKTIDGGSEQYKGKLLAQLSNQTLTNQSISAVGQTNEYAYYFDCNGIKHTYDQIVIAAHADQALDLLERPTNLQSELLSKFQYNRNKAILHTDESVMPKKRDAWASWNVRYSQKSGDTPQSSTHYWMNNLQNLDTDTNYFVSIDDTDAVNPEKIKWEATYRHPLYDEAAISAQSRLHELNHEGRIRFCGSYFRNGFHEDALWSSLKVTNRILEEKGVEHEFLPL